MKLYAPSYYPAFKCIADKCKHSCCIGWEIDIDPDTLNHYETMTHPYGEIIRTSIDYEGDPHFRLTPGERCPHLKENGLCEIILRAGESCLCEICKEHPRFYHETSRGMEVGLGMACEEACRLILTSGDYLAFLTLSMDGEEDPQVCFDTLPHRERLYKLLSEKSSFAERLEEIQSLYGITPKLLSDPEWRTLLGDLEYLDDTHKELFSCYSSGAFPTDEQALERVLAYLIFRHLTPAENFEDLKASLGFCLFCTQLLCSMMAAHPGHTTADLARILSEELEYSTDNTDTIRSVFF